MYKLYTDGAASNNGRKNCYGGWAWILLDENNNKIGENCGFLKNTTNNICELTAIIKGCEFANSLNKNSNIEVISDSAYCINCYKQQWYTNWEKNGWLNAKKQPVKNKELWEQLIPYFRNNNFIFSKVKGHSTNEYNNYVDQKAVEAKLLGR